MEIPGDFHPDFPPFFPDPGKFIGRHDGILRPRGGGFDPKSYAVFSTFGDLFNPPKSGSHFWEKFLGASILRYTPFFARCWLQISS